MKASKADTHPKLDNPSSYRTICLSTICLVNTTGKVNERVIYNRLLHIAAKDDGDFRRAKSTSDAINMVTGLNKIAAEW